MADPTTVNVSLAVPLRGSNVGVWDVPVNGDFTALDGFLGGVATIGLSNAPVTLTTPGAAITPSPGPFEAQNAVLQFTGVLSANVTVTLPMPGIQTIANFTTGSFVTTFKAAGSGAVVATPQGSVMQVYNDGTNVYFLNNIATYPGKQEFLAGVSALPSWIAACTKRPFLVADGSIYNIADFPEVANIFGSKFGGNGFTTFGVPDLQGRVPIAYDGTGTRITTAGCGINGQTLGAAGGFQNITLDLTQIPAHNHGVNDPGHVHPFKVNAVVPSGGNGNRPDTLGGGTFNTDSAFTGITIQNAGGGLPHNNVQPGIVSGIWLIKT